MRLVRDVSIDTKNRIYNFIDQGNKIIFMVDCENSDPYNLCAAIKGLDKEKLGKISKIILYDDKYAIDTWEMLRRYIGIPIEYVMTHRVKDDKSLVEVKLITGTCREFFKNNVDSFVIVSSDSDYWGLIESLSEARFLVMVEHEKCSGKLMDALRLNDIFYCFIDEFYADSDGDSLKRAALLKEASAYFQDYRINLDKMMDCIVARTRVKLMRFAASDGQKCADEWTLGADGRTSLTACVFVFQFMTSVKGKPCAYAPLTVIMN